MTARDEAAEVMAAIDPDLPADWLGVLLDAIPPNVLARLAIERGGLVEAFTSTGLTGERLYRVVEP